MKYELIVNEPQRIVEGEPMPKYWKAWISKPRTNEIGLALMAEREGDWIVISEIRSEGRIEAHVGMDASEFQHLISFVKDYELKEVDNE